MAMSKQMVNGGKEELGAGDMRRSEGQANIFDELLHLC